MIYSKPCEYAIRALTYLASFEAERPALGEEIARAESIPAPILGKILQELVRKGLLDSRRGPGGGFRLSRRPSQITLQEVVAAVDGLDHFFQCVTGLPQCGEDAPCPLHHTWKNVRARILHDLETTSLAEMARAVARKRHVARRSASRKK